MRKASTPHGKILLLDGKERAIIRRKLEATGYQDRAYMQAAIGDACRFRQLMQSRQTGKTTTIAIDNNLTAGRKNLDVMNLSASADQTKELMLRVGIYAEVFHDISGEIQREILSGGMDQDLYVDDDGIKITQTTVTLPNGKRMIGRPANARTARGFSMCVRLDEYSMHLDQKAIWQAATPSITSNKALDLLVSGTPKGKGDDFFRVMTEPTIAEGGIWSRHVVTIFDAIRDGLDADPEVLRKVAGDDDTWRQEYLCEFVDEASAFLTYEMIDRCAHEGLKVIHRLESQRNEQGEEVLDYELANLLEPETLTKDDLYMGIDVGRRKDLTVLWIWQRVGNLLWCRACIELNRVPFRLQEKLIGELIGHYEIRRTCGDETGIGMMLMENLAHKFGVNRVEGISFTTPNKQRLAEGLRPKFEDRACRIPIDALVRQDLHGITKTDGAGGHVRYQGERSGKSGAIHPDRFWAAALATNAADGAPVYEFDETTTTVVSRDEVSKGVLV